jgi:PhzF family phenazine biosynthesis protein
VDAIGRSRDEGFHLRWFTPKAEVELCGHATMATYHALREANWIAEDEQAAFRTLSGQLTAVSSGEKISLDFPSREPIAAEPPCGLIEGVGVQPIYVGTDKTDFMIQLKDESEVRNAKPDFARLKGVKARGVMITAASDAADVDIVSRFFAPAFGINEDPVTGSAHCVLAPYWCRKLGKDSLIAYQASERGGRLDLRLSESRVRLSGTAHTVFRGELLC